MSKREDLDPTETAEWLDALSALEIHRGPERANYVVNEVVTAAWRNQLYVPQSLTTPYYNTIEVKQPPPLPGDRAIEHKVRSIIRWNAAAIVLRANKESSELGGHIASFQSAATLYDIGFGHFWRTPSDGHGGDLIYIQGHSAPGIYARAFVEGRLSEQQLLRFRQEVDGNGLSSYPHPWLMPDFWQFPTVRGPEPAMRLGTDATSVSGCGTYRPACGRSMGRSNAWECGPKAPA
jgi:pyruvate dehydrogenase E1 component